MTIYIKKMKTRVKKPLNKTLFRYNIINHIYKYVCMKKFCNII